MGQEIDIVVSVLTDASLETKVITKNILQELKLVESDKISNENGINLQSSCEKCSNCIKLNIYWDGEWIFRTKKRQKRKEMMTIDNYDDHSDKIVKNDVDTDSSDEEEIFECDPPKVLIKEEPISMENDIKLEPNNFIMYPGVSYPLPSDLVLPSLHKIKAPFFAEMVYTDGTLYYIEKRRETRVTNFDPRSTICDICEHHVPKLHRMTAHRKGHFFNKYGNSICRGCGMNCGEMDTVEKLNHTLFCPGKRSINGLLCMECNFEAKDYRQMKTHLHNIHRHVTNDAILALPLDKMHPAREKKDKKLSDKNKNAEIDEYLSHLSLPETYVLPNLYKLNSQYSRMHPQPDGTSIYVGKGSNHLQVMNFDPRREKCDLCGKSQLKNKPDLIAHRYKDHFFPIHAAGDACQGCKKEFPNTDAKMSHSHFCDKKHLIQVNYCRECNEQFPAYPKYVSHLKKIHDGDGIDGKYMCHLCSSTFERPSTLELHVIKHRDPKPFKCAHCDAEYKGRHGLETHLIRTHFQHEAKNICNACEPPSLFGSNEQYKTHMNVVHFKYSKEKQECPYCKKLIRKLGLGHHIRQQHTNTGRKEKFECPSCNKIFFNKKGLEIHSVIHLPEDQRHFRCRFCGRSFNFKQHLVAHERSHTGEKPFKCETCGKAFPRKQALTDHQREHTGQGYQCSVCSRMFTDRGNYRHHMKQHESQMGVKLTFNHEERRLMRLKVLTAEQALKGGLNDDFA